MLRNILGGSRAQDLPIKNQLLLGLSGQQTLYPNGIVSLMGLGGLDMSVQSPFSILYR